MHVIVFYGSHNLLQETIQGSTLPVKILWKDEAGQLIDFSEHLIERGLAFRNTRFGSFFLYPFRLVDLRCGEIIQLSILLTTFYIVCSNGTPS